LRREIRQLLYGPENQLLLQLAHAIRFAVRQDGSRQIRQGAKTAQGVKPLRFGQMAASSVQPGHEEIQVDR
jgi:hypothetical protein